MILSNKNRFAKILERLINDVQRKPLCEYYGDGTKIEIVTIDFLPTKKVCNIYGKIILGESPDTLSLDPELATLLMGKALSMTLYDYTGNISIGFDV